MGKNHGAMRKDDLAKAKESAPDQTNNLGKQGPSTVMEALEALSKVDATSTSMLTNQHTDNHAAGDMDKPFGQRLRIKGKCERLNLSLPPDLKAALNKVAKLNNTSPSVVVYEILENSPMIQQFKPDPE